MTSQVEARAVPVIKFARRADVRRVLPAQDAFSSQTVSGGIYLAARYGLGVVVSLGNMLVMTWWIGPHAYGLFVTAIGMVAFLAAVARGGVDTYLIRCEVSPDDRMYGTAVTLILVLSAALGLAAAATTPLLVRWYGSREFVAPYLALLVTIPVSGLTGVPMARLERSLDFRRVAGIELAGQAAGLLAAAVLAWARAGVWAPVAGQIVWQTFTLVAAAVSASIALRLRFNACQAREMLWFGAGLTASLRTWQLRTLVNPLLVGRYVGTEGVAFVALAIRIAESLGTFRLAAGRMAIAALARLRNNGDEFRSCLGTRTLPSSDHLGTVIVWVRPVRTVCGEARDRGAVDAEPRGLSLHRCRRTGEFDLQPAGLRTLCDGETMGGTAVLYRSRGTVGGWHAAAAPLRHCCLWLGRTSGLRTVLGDPLRLGEHGDALLSQADTLGSGFPRRSVSNSRRLHPAPHELTLRIVWQTIDAACCLPRQPVPLAG